MCVCGFYRALRDVQDKVRPVSSGDQRMAKVDLGTKRVCPECGAKFYDLTKNPAICPMCQHSFDPEELENTIAVPTGPLKPQKSQLEDEDEEEKTAVNAEDMDDEDIDEEEAAAKELELDGDDVAVIGGAAGGDDEQPGYDGYSDDEDQDEDAALVEDDNELPPPDDGDDDDDVEEIEI